MISWNKAFDERSDLIDYGDNSLGLFALALNFRIEGLDSIAADSITDGPDDKKIDIIHINNEVGYAVIIQCYMSKKGQSSAPSNKASDLNAGINWLLQSPLNELPKRLKPSAESLRDGMKSGSIEKLDIWYVHNLDESINVQKEMITVENAAKSILKNSYPNNEISVRALEVGNETLNDWYADTQSPILVPNKFEIEYSQGSEIKESNWDAFLTAIPLTFLYEIYGIYKIKLFSANVRDYLGSRDSDSNINHGIKETAVEDPHNFWVFNNGLTILVNEYKTIVKNNKKFLIINGLSIVNGAQTTGAIAHLKKIPSKDAFVQARFVKTSDSNLIKKIILFNNSQNKTKAPDFRSTDNIQKRLKLEVSKIPETEYEGGRRGGASDVIQRRANLLVSATVGQALTAFHGDPMTAYNHKTNIWLDDNLYDKIFNYQTTGHHVVFVYGLLRAIENKKKALVNKTKISDLTNFQEQQLEFFRSRGSIYLFVAAISRCLETYLNDKVLNIFRVSFGPKSTKKSEQIWSKIIESNSAFCLYLQPAINDGLKNEKNIKKALNAFQAVVEASKDPLLKLYGNFKKNIITT